MTRGLVAHSLGAARGAGVTVLVTFSITLV